MLNQTYAPAKTASPTIKLFSSSSIGMNRRITSVITEKITRMIANEINIPTTFD